MERSAIKSLITPEHFTRSRRRVYHELQLPAQGVPFQLFAQIFQEVLDERDAATAAATVAEGESGGGGDKDHGLGPESRTPSPDVAA